MLINRIILRCRQGDDATFKVTREGEDTVQLRFNEGCYHTPAIHIRFDRHTAKQIGKRLLKHGSERREAQNDRRKEEAKYDETENPMRA